jgi:hypothetical protein
MEKLRVHCERDVELFGVMKRGARGTAIHLGLFSGFTPRR